jgi:preprotein translocase subunit SecG
VVTYIYIAQIILSIALIGLILLQAKGAGFGGAFGGDSAVYRTRRGAERTIFNATIGIAVLFFLTAIVSVLLA